MSDDSVDVSARGGGTLDEESGTLVRHGDDDDSGGTMIQHATLVPDSDKNASADANNTGVESYLGTMVINEDGEDEDDDTMKSNNSKRVLTYLNKMLNYKCLS